MKSSIKIFLFMCVCVATFVSCETYSDPKVENTAIYPLSGEWRIRIKNMTTNALVVTGTTSMYTLGTYNTADNSSSQMWIRTTTNVASFHPTSTLRTLKSKINCDVPSLSFSTTGVVQNLGISNNAVIDTVVISEGKIDLNSVSLPSGVKSDRISFKLTKTKAPGVTYFVDGYRRTRWYEDETVIDFK